jgi:hypothetical protein
VFASALLEHGTHREAGLATADDDRVVVFSHPRSSQQLPLQPGRRTPMTAFQTLLGLQSQQQPTTYRSIVASGPALERLSQPDRASVP